MKVTLINRTQDAKELLIFTKNTRLQMHADLLGFVHALTDEEKQEELDYMVNTIKSSWEFMSFTFMIEDVTRAFTHQFVRNRQGSYAQQTMRILDVSGFTYHTGPSIENEYQQKIYDSAMENIQASYNALIGLGVNIEDARGLLPTNIHTNIVCKFNLRTLSDMMASRASTRTQSEYRDVIELMYQAVVEAEPWVAPFLRDAKGYALKKIESLILSDYEGTDACTHYLKLVDQVRNAK
jgi:thymidylate synthase (FAD)